jgi:hypothetical protein
MWDPQRLTTLWAFTACYRDSFTFFFTLRYGLESRQEQGFSPLHSVQTDSGAHPTSYPMSTGGSFPGVKRPVREAVHSPPTSAEVKNGGATSPLPHTPLPFLLHVVVPTEVVQWLRLALSNGPPRVGVSHPLTRGRKRIQFLKRCVL